WKCLTENFMESYHLPVAHRETVGANFTVSENTFGEAGDADDFAFQFFTKTEGAPVGRAHPANDRLDGDWRRTSVMPTVFPSHMYVLAPDHLWYLSLQPDGVGRTRIRYGAALAPEVMDSADDSLALIAEKKAFLDKVQVEDKHVVEGIFNGAMSPLAVPGPLSWMEQENHQFARYLARHLCD
ncbi:MAG: SRPBCC family protein, partial [Pseudomonadota bacterium]|nr:SRPBCC family protein [Pseudomonadota bacterium]